MSQSTLRRSIFLLLTAVLAAGPFSASALLAQAPGPGQAAPAGPTLPLTMQQAVDMALQQNLGLQANRLGPQMAAQDTARARSVFTPNFSSGYSRNTKDSRASSVFEAAGSVVSSNSDTVSSGFGQALPWYGGSYQVSWTGSRSETNAFSSFNPQLNSTFSATFSQPLLRNLRIDSARATVKAAERTQQIADSQLTDAAGQTERNARLAYLQLIIAIQSRNVAQQNLDVANAQYRNNKARVDVGVTAPADLVSAEAEVSTYEEALIVAESAIESQMDQLRELILDPSRPDYWTVRLVPTDTVAVEPPAIDIDAAVKNALAQRTDLLQARKSIEITDLNINLLNNLKLPAVDFRVNYVGSGTAGTQIDYNNDFPPTIKSQSTRAFSGALGDSFGNAYPSWTYGVQVSYPIGKSDTEASLARAEIAKRQSELQLRDLELQIATQVRDAARQVETNYKRVQTTRAGLRSQEERLEAEQKRFDVGLSDTFKLVQIQRDVANARVSELQAELGYSRALINFEAVQRIR